MARYRKGANAERELIRLFFDLGFSVVRVAGSGKTALPAPDILALKEGKTLAIECKAWKASHLAIPIEQVEELSAWGKRAGIDVFIAWKIPLKGWFFLTPDQFNKTGKNYIVSRKTAFKKARNLNVVSGVQSVIGCQKSEITPISANKKTT